MNRLCALIFTLTVVMTVYARTITGRVLSDNDSTAVAEAICKLMDGDRIVTDGVSDAEGCFSLSTQNRKSLLLTVIRKGFSQTDVFIADGKGNVDLGTVYLSAGTELDEVTVTASSIFNSRGRTIIYPTDLDRKASSTAISLFQKMPLPGLIANPINRSITIDNGNPMILINGVPSTIDDVNALEAKDILKIEYSRDTPARYAARGTTGLVSITLRERNDGGSVYIWGRSAVNTAFMDGNARVSYHQGPSQFTIYYNPSWRNYQKVYDFYNEAYIAPDFRVDLESHDRNPFNYFSNPASLKYNFAPSASTLLSVTFNASSMTSGRRFIGEGFDSFYDERYDIYRRTSSRRFSPSLDIFFRQDFNEKNSLEIEAVGTVSTDKYRRENIYDYIGQESQKYQMDVDNKRRSLITEISYIHDFSDNMSLSAGCQNTVSHSKNTYLTTDYEPILTENNNYLYAAYTHRIGKVYLQLSTGLKMYWIKNDDNRDHFFRNRSSLNVSWNVNSHWDLYAAFNYSPGIPSLSSLTDYSQQTTPYLISNGNPELKASDSFFYYFRPSYNYKKLFVSLSFEYGDVKNAVVNDVRYLGDHKFMSQSVNADRNSNISTSLYFRLAGIYGFGINGSISFDRFLTEVADDTHTLSNFSGYFTLWWNKGPVTISYYRIIPGKTLSGTQVLKSENGDGLQVDYKPDDHWTFGAMWSYMFDTKGTKYPNWDYSPVKPATIDRYIKDNGNMVTLSVSYSGDFGSIFRSARRNLNNKDTGSSLLKL